MLVKKIEQTPAMEMAVPGAKGVTMRLMVGRDDGAPNFAMRQFEVQPGGHTPHHQHNYEHEVLILGGHGEVTGGVTGQDVRPIAAGDVVYMPANELHQFRNTGDEPLRFMCMVPTRFDCGADGERPTPGS